MTVCNMSIEAGARAGHDRAGRDHLRLPRRAARTRRRAPTGTRRSRTGSRCATDDGAAFDREVALDAADAHARSSPGAPTRARALPLDGARARPRGDRPTRPRTAAERALEYMGLTAGHPAARDRGRHRLRRLLHQRPASRTCAPPPTCCAGRKVADGVRMLVVPGSMQVKRAGRGRGAGRGLHGGRRRVARGRLLDVPGHEPGHARAGRALRLHLQPQLRGPPGQGRPHPPGLAGRSPPPPPSPAA